MSQVPIFVGIWDIIFIVKFLVWFVEIVPTVIKLKHTYKWHADSADFVDVF